MARGFNTRVRFKPNRKAAAQFDAKFLAAAIDGAKEVIDYAVDHHPYQDRTGLNSGSIGWAASSSGKTSFGTLKIPLKHRKRDKAGRFSGGGGSDPSPVRKRVKRHNEVIVATTSGYGGFLETGTSKMAAFPYLIPALRASSQAIKRLLDGVLGRFRPGQRRSRGGS